MDNESRMRENFLLMKRWMENKNAGKSFSEYFQQCGYRSVAIYGAGDIGKLLFDELKQSDIQVKYFVDRNGEGIHEMEGLPVVAIHQVREMEEVDVLVVTLINAYDSICKMLAGFAKEIRTLSIREAGPIFCAL